MSMGSVTGVGAGFQSALDLKQDALTEYTYATLPTASSNTGLRVWVTDVGINGGSEWRSDGVDWFPVSGEVILYHQPGVRLIAGSGNIVAGSADTLTQTDSLTGNSYPSTPKYALIYLPAVASTPAVTAGWYTVEITGTSSGTILSAGVGSAPITFSVGAAFTGTTTRVDMHTCPIPAGVFVGGCRLKTTTNIRMASNATSRSVYISLGGVDCFSYAYTSATYANIPEAIFTTMADAVDAQITTRSVAPSDLTTVLDVSTTVDMSIAQNYVFAGMKAATGTRMVTRDFTVRLIK